MLIKFSDYLSIDDGVDVSKLFAINTFPLNSNPNVLHLPEQKVWLPPLDSNKKIYIQGKEYQVVDVSTLARHKGSDGKYHAIYIWIDYDSGEYYIGKVNRAKWTELRRYTGSGVKFKGKYRKHEDRFARYYLFACDSEKETEEIEAKIVNEELLKDPFCLNLIKGGGGISAAPVSQYRKDRQSEYMKEHPERYKAMLEATRNFDEEKIRQRSLKIKEKMSSDYYKEMSRERIKKWKERDPEGYKVAREKNRQSINDPNSKAKRKESLQKWKDEHPEELAVWEENRKKALASPESKKKHSDSIKEWIKNHPEKQKENQARRLEGRRKKQRGVAMIDLKTGKTIRTFYTPKDAAIWLIDNGYTKKGSNPSSTICDVCKKKKIPGHGTKKSAYGFGWEYVEH